jgi:hypothetical protein
MEISMEPLLQAPATFKVESPTEIIAAVPSGATSGNVEVVTSGGTLKAMLHFGWWNKEN